MNPFRLVVLLLVLLAVHCAAFAPTILFDPSSYLKADLLLHDFRAQIPSVYPYRCVLRTESKFFRLTPACQLLSRTSLKPFCSFNATLTLEIVFPQNTTVYEVHLRSNQTNCNRNQLCQFERNPYRIKLKENELYRNFLPIRTTAACTASNYLLASTNAKRNFEYFAVNASTGYLSLLQPLDYEAMPTWKIVIQAHDVHRIPFYTYVIIDVDDTNDCPPLLSWNFPLQTIQVLNDTDPFAIEIAVHESKVEQKGVIIANLIASDLDSPPKFDLRINASDALPFTIDGPYGDSTYVLLTSSALDRESREQYVVSLVIGDHGKPSLTSYYRLLVHVIDANDNAPRLDKQLYYVDIQENNFVNTTLLQIFANDSDSAENARLTYALSDEGTNYVWIDGQTGIVRANIRFDYEEMRNFTFNVTVVDHPKIGPQLKATATVLVNIIDQNDNVPQVNSTHRTLRSTLSLSLCPSCR